MDTATEKESESGGGVGVGGPVLVANNAQAAASEIMSVIESAKSMGLVAFSGELMLLEWSKSSSKDMPKIKFGLASDEDVAPFEMAHIRKGKRVGQRYLAVMFELSDDETITTEADRGGPSSEDDAAAGHPYGKHARELFRAGFFYSAPVRQFAEGLGHESVNEISRLFALKLGYASAGDIPPAVMMQWSKKAGVLLPGIYSKQQARIAS